MLFFAHFFYDFRVVFIHCHFMNTCTKQCGVCLLFSCHEYINCLRLKMYMFQNVLETTNCNDTFHAVVLSSCHIPLPVPMKHFFKISLKFWTECFRFFRKPWIDVCWLLVKIKSDSWYLYILTKLHVCKELMDLRQIVTNSLWYGYHAIKTTISIFPWRRKSFLIGME